MHHGIRKNIAISATRDSAGDPSRHVWLADWRRFSKPYCTLYVVSTDSNWPCKIGISNNPARRVNEIQISVWKQVKVDYSVWCNSSSDARLLEKAMHKELNADGRRLRGEWFDIHPERVVDLIKFKAAVIGVECSDRVYDEEIVQDIAIMLEDRVRYSTSTPQRLKIVRNLA
jgi:hypothetical protein